MLLTIVSKTTATRKRAHNLDMPVIERFLGDQNLFDKEVAVMLDLLGVTANAVAAPKGNVTPHPMPNELLPDET